MLWEGICVETSAFIQPSIAAFITALSLACTAAVAFRTSRTVAAGQWRWFAAFAALFSAAACIAIFEFQNGGTVLRVLSLVFAAASSLTLIEFGRRHVTGNAKRYLKPWLHLPLAAFAALVIALRGLAGLELASRYLLAIPAAALAGLVLAQRARASDRWEPALAAAAIVFLAIGFAFSVGPLVAFAALGLLSAIWCESRRQLPLDSGAGPVKRWRSPAAFLAVAIAGVTILAMRDRQIEQTAFAISIADGAGSAAAADDTLDSIAIDPRQLTRDRASAQRTKQAVILLAVIVAVAGVWGGLAYWSNRRA
jgi:hypothetical protein